MSAFLLGGKKYMDNCKNHTKCKKNGRKQKMKLIFICGVLIVSISTVGASLSKSISQEYIKEKTYENSSKNIFERHTEYIDSSDWNLLLVNPWNKIPGEYFVELTNLVNGHSIDKRVYPDLQAMIDAMRTEGLYPVICSSYRTYEKQQTLFNNEVSQCLAQGYSQKEAEAEAGKSIAIPGTSEHQTGLAVDIVDISYQILDENQENTAVQKWLIKNSYKYGFILRYPKDKSEITGIYYEPWHYRYVGKEVAKEIYEKGICLEEYLDSTK